MRAEEKVLDPNGVDAFHGWIRDWISAGKPMDQFVRALLVATGSTYDIAFHPGQPVYMWVSVFDHTQTRHTRHMRPVRVDLK